VVVGGNVLGLYFWAGELTGGEMSGGERSGGNCPGENGPTPVPIIYVIQYGTKL